MATELEQVLKEGQASEEIKEETLEEEVEEVEESPKEEEGKEAQKDDKEPDIESKVRSEVDKRLNTYREKREADTAYIRKLQSDNTELKRGSRERMDNKFISSILSEDEESGYSADDTKSRETALKEFSKRYQDYQDKASEVEEASQLISTMKVPPNIVKEFGLDDPNPNTRAVNGAKFLDETVSIYKYVQNFQMAIEEFLPKGDEVRKKLDEIAEGLADFESEKSKKLYLQDQLKGLKVTPRKKPPAPSDTPGGEDISNLDGKELLRRGFKKEFKGG